MPPDDRAKPLPVAEAGIDPAETELTIAELAKLTGIEQATLRAWEARHGLPAPHRLVNGHRRYRAGDAELIRTAAEHRRQGLSVAAALRSAREGLATRERPDSIFAALTRAREHLVPQPVGHSALTAISRALEDECRAQASSGLLLGCFQREAFYRASERRWRSLAADMELTIVLADFSRRRVRERAPCEIPLKRASPMISEWVLIAPSGCVLARERPGAAPTRRERTFDALWSPEPDVVHAAARIFITMLGSGALSERALALLGPAPPPSSAALRRTAALTNRIIGYVSSDT
ncbi:MAG: DICT sensory domain-containing protein [Solirubrobacteraceae bacterium]